MKILLTGKNGQLGFELQRTLAPLGHIFTIDINECNLADPEAVRALIRKVKPDLIVNPAAYTAVDKAESEPELAKSVNSIAPAIMAEEAQRINAWIIHYSTDYVFDGSSTRPYLETDSTNPLNVYGVTKRDGDLALQQACARHLIFRTSWVVGAHGNNFAKTMLRLASERESLSIVNDQFGAPTSAALLADTTAQIIGRAQRDGLDTLPFGLYNLTASDVTTWHGFACFVLEQAQKNGLSLKVKPEMVKPIATADYPLPAKRPANSQLDTTLFQSTFGLTLPDWQDGLNHILQQIL
ncbi:dTDP-4-dehydrorhamnose reductase [Desulfobulbus rhabdoformis]|uniref:dTDP-4-dehydrorhamnose reductase n=1 Tax=Desulfobulbus rhabdoformis TaxID=34032 RepID=UPI001962AD7D|nr:dTDP-4-dehydrorhamnose reductase [Desulfobulbus rhabdoformis]MBM9616094.1 dTDP-4-dehydrorhamnose reductase [Desulfobulbus rhabdoformis]